MTVLTVFVALCAAVSALQLALSVGDRFRPRGMLSERVRRTLIVHRVGLPSIRGVLVDEQPEGLVLRRAEYLVEPEHRGEDAPEPVQLDGDTLVRWEIVDCVQDLSATAAHAPRRRAQPVMPARALTPVADRFASAPADPRPRRAA
jgi:hypothetical protein